MLDSHSQGRSAYIRYLDRNLATFVADVHDELVFE